MKKLLFLLTMAMMAISANAQSVVAEIDWTKESAWGDLWYDSNYADVTVTLGTGLIIDCSSDGTNNYWEPQIPMLGHIPELDEGGHYQLKFTANSPVAGELRLDVCSWDESGATSSCVIDVVAGEKDYVVDFEDYPTACTDAMIFYQCGKLPGRHIIKSVQIIDLNAVKTNWTVAGDEALLGANWDASSDNNNMRTKDDENYTLTKRNLTLLKGTYQYKVYNNTTPDTESYPTSGKASLVIDEDATYTVVFTFNSKTQVLSAKATKTDGLFFNFNEEKKTAELTYNPNSYKGTVVIPSTVTHEGEDYTVTRIAENAFSYCRNLTSVTIPNSVTSIGQWAFDGCSGLTSITIPNSVKSIEYGAFGSCIGLTSFTIPDGVETIEGSTFLGCRGLTSVTIPNSVTSIRWNAFDGCSGLTSITIPNSVTSIGGSAFQGCSGLTSITIPNGVTYIESSVFRSCSGLTSISIPNSVMGIDEYAFEYCSGLTSVTIPNSVTGIGDYAFSNCSGLTSVTIPDKVTYIGPSAFRSCSGLTSVTIPNSVMSIDRYAFQNCSGLKSVTIGEKVSEINSSAFANCPNLADVSCLATNVPSTNTDAFNNSNIEHAILQVPAASLSSYSNADPWKNFGNKVAINGGSAAETNKCATPTISVENGKVKFTCKTEGVEFVSSISAPDAKNYNGNELTLSCKYMVTVYATKSGYLNSDTATTEIVTTPGKLGDLNGDGKVDVADHVTLSDIIMSPTKE